MAAQSYGTLTLTYGVPTMTGMVVQASTTTSRAAVVAEVFDENGVRVFARYDDITDEASIEAVVAGGAIPVPGTVVTLGTVKYEVQSVDVKRSSKEFSTVTIKGKRSEKVSLGVVV